MSRQEPQDAGAEPRETPLRGATRQQGRREGFLCGSLSRGYSRLPF